MPGWTSAGEFLLSAVLLTVWYMFFVVQRGHGFVSVGLKSFFKDCCYTRLVVHILFNRKWTVLAATKRVSWALNSPTMQQPEQSCSPDPLAYLKGPLRGRGKGKGRRGGKEEGRKREGKEGKGGWGGGNQGDELYFQSSTFNFLGPNLTISFESVRRLCA